MTAGRTLLAWAGCGAECLMVGASLLVFSSARAGADVTEAGVYARDVDFLLVELERKAGHFFKAKHIDWVAVTREFREEVRSVKSDVEHVKLCQRLMCRLKDGHAGLVDIKVRMPDEAGGRRRTGPCVHLLTIGDRVYVRAAFGPAAREGLKVGEEVKSIEGLAAWEWLQQRVAQMRDRAGYSTDHQALYAACHWGLADWEGTSIAFEAGGKRVKLTRRGGSNFVPFGPIHAPAGLKRIGRQSYGKTASGNGYIHLRDVPADLGTQLDQMLAEMGGVPGLILDLRANGGGGGDQRAMVGRFVGAGKRWRQYGGAGPNPFEGPMVVIVDAGTRSAGETFGGMLKEDGRAYVIGDQPTAGMSSSKERLPVPSGLFAAYFAIHSNMARFNNGLGIEGLGVTPHEIVAYDPAELARGVDTQIRRAEELLKGGLPKDRVPFEAAREK